MGFLSSLLDIIASAAESKSKSIDRSGDPDGTYNQVKEFADTARTLQERISDKDND